MSMGTRALAPLLVALALAGCAAVNPRAPFGGVKELVSARGALAVSWPESPEAASEVDRTVAELLSQELSAQAAVRLALVNNRNLQALYQELGVAQAELVQAGLLPNPVVNANVRFGLGPSGTGTEMGLVQDLIAVLQIPLRKRVAAANLERAKAEVANAVIDLALETKERFFTLQGELQSLELRKTVAAATALSRAIAERQHAAGNISDLDLRTEQALDEEAKVELAVSEAATLQGREELNGLLGLWGPQTAWSMGTRLPRIPQGDVPAKGLESLAVSQRLDLVVARTQGLSQLAQLRLNRFYGLIPFASAGVAAEREVDGGWSVGPAIDVPIPLFDQSQAIIAAGAARVRASNERFAALAVEIRAQVRRAWTRLEAARQRSIYYERVLLPLQTELVEQAQRQYNGMQIGPIQLVQAKRDQIETGRRYIETLTEYWLARTELERAVGGELSLAPDTAPPAPPPSEPSDGKQMHEHHHGG